MERRAGEERRKQEIIKDCMRTNEERNQSRESEKVMLKKVMI